MRLKLFSLIALLCFSWKWPYSEPDHLGFKVYVDDRVVQEVGPGVFRHELKFTVPGRYKIEVTAFGKTWQTRKSTARYYTVL